MAHPTGFRAGVTAVLIGIAAFLIYHSCGTYDFLNYDDGRVLVDHPELYNQASLGASIRSILFESYPREEPLLLRDISWALDSRLFGFSNPHGFHLINVVWHAVAMAIFFLFVLQITRRQSVALLSTLLALTLAIHVEPVAWIMGRKDLMVTTFGLLCLIAVSRMIDSRTRLAQALYYAASLVFLVLALFSKISAIVLPLACMLLAIFHAHVRRQCRPDSAIDRRTAVLYSLAFLPHLIVSVAVYHWYRQILTTYGVLNRGYTASPLEHIATLATVNPFVLLRYLHNLLLPGPMRLFYNWPSLAFPFAWWHRLAAGLVIAVLLGLLALLYRRRKDLLFFLLAFLILMIPYMNLLYIGIWVANRYLYFSSLFLLVGLSVIAVQGLNDRRLAIRMGVVFLLTGSMVINGIRKADYLPRWRDNETLWTYAMALPDPSPEAFLNRASHAYTLGVRTTDPVERERQFATVRHVIAEARTRFTAVQIYRLLFLDALMRIVRDEPAAAQLAALQDVERLNPTFDAVLWQLTVFHYKEALKLEDRQAREAMGRRALDTYRRYREQAPTDSATAARHEAIKREFLSDMPFLESELEALP